jgi:hypothetical protein
MCGQAVAGGTDDFPRWTLPLGLAAIRKIVGVALQQEE